jgi:hypothetical protein
VEPLGRWEADSLEIRCKDRNSGRIRNHTKLKRTAVKSNVSVESSTTFVEVGMGLLTDMIHLLGTSAMMTAMMIGAMTGTIIDPTINAVRTDKRLLAMNF